MSVGETMVDTIDDTTHSTIMVTNLNDPGWGGYPYMDTLRFFNTDTISNDSNVVGEGYLVLCELDGYPENQGQYSEYYDELIDPENDDMSWCEDVDDYRYDTDCFLFRLL